MKKPKHRVRRPAGAREDSLSRAYRLAWLYGGIPFVVLAAIFIAAGRAPGLADFLFWVAVIWIVIVRYVELSCLAEGFLQPSPDSLRKWRRFAVVLAIAGGVLYSLARIAGRPAGLDL